VFWRKAAQAERIGGTGSQTKWGRTPTAVLAAILFMTPANAIKVFLIASAGQRFFCAINLAGSRFDQNAAEGTRQTRVWDSANHAFNRGAAGA